MKIARLVTLGAVVALIVLFSIDAVAALAPKRLPMNISPYRVREVQQPQAPQYETIDPAGANCEDLPSEYDVLDTNYSFNLELREIVISRPSGNIVGIGGNIYARGIPGTTVPDDMAFWSRITIPGMETIDICRATNYMRDLGNAIVRDFWSIAVSERMIMQNPTTTIIGHPLIVEVDPDNHVNEWRENDNTITCTSLELPPENAPPQLEYVYNMGYTGVCYVPRREPVGEYVPSQ